jgi:hypothetical protein
MSRSLSIPAPASGITVIGTVQQYPNIEEAWQASNGLRVSINEARYRQQEQLVTVLNFRHIQRDFGLGGSNSSAGVVRNASTGHGRFPLL